MLRIYLDQNKWVDLARASKGQARAEKFQGALAMCRAGVAAGEVYFPLDMYRYWELGKRRDDRSRNDVADVMSELSEGHTMVTPFSILDHEIDLALRRRFGVPSQPRPVQVFGTGMRHIAGDKMTWPRVALESHPELRALLPVGTQAQLDARLNELVEDALLRAGPREFLAAGLDHAAMDHAARFVEFEEGVAAKLKEQRSSGIEVDMMVRAADLSDIRPAVEDGLARIGLTLAEFIENVSATGTFEFLDDLPSRYVTNVLRTAKHRQGQQKWTENDFVDVLALPIAAVYCDVVVTEKQWVHQMRQGKVPERYNTVVMSDVSKLENVIVEASVR